MIGLFVITIFILTTFDMLHSSRDVNEDTDKTIVQSLRRETEKTEWGKKLKCIQSYEVVSEKVPDSLKTLFDKDSPKRERMKAIFGLSNDLTEEEIACLYSFLANDRNDSHYLFAKDEIMVKLEKQLKRPVDYEMTLAGIVKNRQIDGDLRGYAVQHLRMAWSVEGVDKEFVEALLWDSVNDYESDVSGTALLALNEIMTKTDRLEELDTVQLEAEKLALGDNSYKTSRLTALSLIMQHGEVSDPIKDLANDILAEDSNYDTAFKLVAKKIIGRN